MATLKPMLKKEVMRLCDFAVGSCGLQKSQEFLDQLSNYWLNKDSAPMVYCSIRTKFRK
jgi:hypothetical protein